MARVFTCLVCIFAATFAVAATPELPFLSPLFSEHLMLQRGKPNRLWGWTQPGEKIRVTIADVHAETAASADGRWQVEFMPPPAGGPYALTVDGPQRIEFKDVLVGDLWLCSGQSNMEFDLTRSREGAEAVKNSTHDGIRLFRVASQPAYESAPIPRGEWQRCAPEAFTRSGGFSAVAYYFGRKLHAETGVPIGLIQAAVGGTPAESWMSATALEPFPEFAPGLVELARLRENHAPTYGNFVMHWYDEFDRGVAGKWSDETFDDRAWTTTTLHGAFASLDVSAAPAVVWLRRDLELPELPPTAQAKLLLGVVEKMDTVWINGVWIGASAWVENPRAYSIPAGVLRTGRNQITIRVLKTQPDGGFRSPSNSLKIDLGNGTTLPLEPNWRATIGVDARPPHPLPLGYENWPTMPTVLSRGMIQPLVPLAITGAIWYQGEANFTRASQYRRLLPALIADWRRLFLEPELPFYIVGLPAFMQRRDEPGASDGWTELREAQALTARTVPHAGLAVTIDTGDADNIHPTDKKPVGERLALLALQKTYGRTDIVSEGPAFTRIEKIPSALRVRFDHTEGGLRAHGSRLEGFAIAGADQVWHWADARIEGDSVIVSSPAVPNPTAARYAWQANPPATLFNGAGLPAAPFRTDAP